MLSIEGNLIVLLKLALNCKLWTESNLPSLNGIKAIDNRVYTIGTERSRYVINTRPSHNLLKLTKEKAMLQLFYEIRALDIIFILTVIIIYLGMRKK